MKRYSRLWVILILSFLTIFALIKLGNIEISLQTLARVHWGWYFLVFVSYYASVVARGWRWQHILIAVGWRVGFIYSTALLTAGLFASAILPARAGDIGRVVMLKQDHKIPVSQGIASIAGERALDIFAILTMAIISAWLALPGKIPTEALQLMIAVGVLFVFGLIGLLVIPGLETWLRELKFLENTFPANVWLLYQKGLDFGFSLIHGVRRLGQNPVALAIIVAQSFFIWLWDVLMIYFILISVGIIAPFSVSLFTALISDLATAFPLTPAALGQFDAVVIGLLALFGVSVADASLTVLLLRLIQLWTFIPVSALITYAFGFSRALNIKISPTEFSQSPALPATNPAEG